MNRRRIVNVAEAKAQLSDLIERAAGGEEIILARAGKPRARLVRIDAGKTRRVQGKNIMQFRVKPGFDDPLPEWLLAAFEGRAPRRK
ncbi:MAG: type II toxin-antitoxin system Phd/YefM family antitoxin [Polyangiaceae bacterium]